MGKRLTKKQITTMPSLSFHEKEQFIQDVYQIAKGSSQKPPLVFFDFAKGFMIAMVIVGFVTLTVYHLLMKVLL